MNFTITNRIIDTENDENLISYNTDYIANFSFDEEWEGTVKTARFIQNGAHEDKVLVNDSCEIPSLKNGVVRIGVFNDTMTSTFKLLKVRHSIKDDSGNPAEPEPDVYAQLISLIQSGMLKGKDGYTPVKGKDYFTPADVEEIIGEADVFSQKAGESATAAEQSASASAGSALASEQSARNAAASEKAASDSAKAASTSKSNAAASETAAKKSETAAATSAKSAADSATAAEKSKSDAQTIVDNFGSTVEEATTGAVNTVNETKDNAVNEVNALLDTIPEDYTAMSEDVENLKSVTRTKAGAIVNDASGAFISVDDAANEQLNELVLYGKSEQVKLTGKNLCPPFKISSVSADYIVTDRFDVDASNQYTISIGYKPELMSMQIFQYDSDGNSLGYLNIGVLNISSNFPQTITFAEGTVKALIQIYKSNGVFTDIPDFKVQLEKGSTATDYEPYCGGIPSPNPEYPQEIKSVESAKVTACGKNLFDANTNPSIALFTNQGDGVYYATRTQIGNVLKSKLWVNDGNYSGQICLSYKTKKTADSSTYPNNSSIVPRFFYTDGTNDYGTTTSGSDWVSIAVKSTAGKIVDYIGWLDAFGGDMYIKDIQLELGASATDYEPYQAKTATLSDIVLRATPDGTRDRVVKVNGLWKVERNIEELILDGVTNNKKIKNTWGADYMPNPNGVYCMYMTLPVTRKKSFCTHLKYSDGSVYDATDSGFGGNSGAADTWSFFFKDVGITTYEQANRWLADEYANGNPVTIYYSKDAPTYEVLPDSIQAELNALESYYGTTNIFTDSALQPDMSIKYTADTKLYIDKKFNELAAAIVAQ